ncbi:DUF1264-domain-containing protein [Cystobasidium minutum MCA 4210]|uniref:DUF1264-domain-containing protein n=1 Tax=Cystobasidium minutum MCA 4210 TaxID=1397322 RepID=UPI0034CDABF9|eukprot:jgi/Rhomi1/81798/CE81797_8501
MSTNAASEDAPWTHKLAKGAVEQLGGPVQSFEPVNQICQHLSGIHCYAHDLTRQVIAEHYCTHKGNMHQCIIYDSDKPDARLIGIEYIIDEPTFMSLSADEKRYWHSHVFEVESGQLTVVSKRGVPNAAIDLAERPVLQDLRKTFGKTIHTWQYDVHPELPLGPPQMMLAFTAPGQADEELVKKRDTALGISSDDKHEQRKEWLDPPMGQYKKPEGADQWTVDGKSIQLEVKEVNMKLKKD